MVKAIESFDIYPRGWHKLTKKNDKEVSEKLKRIFTILKYLLTRKAYEKFTYKYFMNTLNRSQSQVRRYFDEFEEAGLGKIVFCLKLTREDGKEYLRCLDIKLTEKGLSILGLQKLISSHEYSALMLSKNADYSIYIDNINNNITNKDLVANCDLNLSQEEQNHENQGHNFSFSNQGAYEVQKDSNKETQLSRSIPLKESQGNITSQVGQYSSQQAVVQTRDVNGSYYNKLLKDFKFTDELLGTVRRLSNKPDISIDQIKAIIRNIVTNNPETEIWGGNKAFVNYVVRAVNNEKEYSKKIKASSIAEMDKKAREKAALMYENKMIEFFN